MARYPYNPGLPAPGKWTSIDFVSPRLEGAVRMMVHSIQAEVLSFVPPAGVVLYQEPLTAWDGTSISCYVFAPEGEERLLPSMLYCHGGGFFLPVQPMMMHLAAQYAGRLHIRVCLPEYRILPEYRNPYPFRDCLSVLKRIQEQDTDYLLYGESAGGALAAGLALWTRDNGSRPARGQCLIYPVTDNRCSRYPSMRLYSEAAWPLKNNLAMWREYLKNGRDGLDGYLIPMLATDVSGLPEAYVEPQQIDTLRDEAIAYAKRMRDAGNDVQLNVVEGSYHGFDVHTDHPFVQSVVQKRIEVMRSMLL